MMENFFEKRITLKSLICVIVLFVILFGVGYLIMDYKMGIIKNEYAEYKVKSQQKVKELQHDLDSVTIKYDSLYNNLDKICELSWNNVDFWADYYGIKNKKAVLSQIALETGYLKSNICLNYNNLVGMHYPTKRETSASGYVKADGGSRVAVYDYWWLSIKDYKLWQDYFGYDEEHHIDDYMTLLDNHGTIGYAKASKYTDTVKDIHDNIIPKLIASNL